MEVSVLHCIICPLQPSFSDVSHLLTHISSKAHLSHYFKLQVRSHQNGEASQLLSEYDGWFKANNLARLLADRIYSKDDRKKKKTSQVKTEVDPPDLRQYPALSTSRRPGPVDSGPHSKTSRPPFLDPRLAESYEKVEKNLEGEDVSFSCQVALAPPVSAPVGGRMVLTNTSTRVTRSRNKTNLGNWPDEEATGLGRNDKTSFPVTPTPRTRIRNQPSGITWNTGKGFTDPFTDGKAQNETWDDADAEKERADEIARLKGILWPGMDLFDSATRQMRRKRNQKKDGAVLKMMEVTSSMVEPTELIFSSGGALLKERVISGNVEDDSPLKGETPPPPKPRASRARQSRSKRGPLTQIDSNVRRGRSNKRTKRASKRGRSSSEEEEVQDRTASFPLHNPFGGDRSDLEDDDDDLSLTVRAFANRPRAKLTIFADEDEPEPHLSCNQSVQSKYTRDTLTPARLVLDNKSDMSKHREEKAHEPCLDKENIEPILNPQGRIDLPSWSNSPFLKRRNNQGYTPRFMVDGLPSMMFGYDADRGQCGYGPNPLFAPSSRVNFFDDGAYEYKPSSTRTGLAATSRADSSEATVSEEEHHELARLYLENTTD